VNKNSLKKQLKKLDSIEEHEINYSDIPDIDLDSMKQVNLQLPKKVPITIRCDDDIIDWFKARGKGYQTKMNMVLRAYVESHKQI